MKVTKIILKKAVAILVISVFFTLLNPAQVYAGTGEVKIKLTTANVDEAGTDNTIYVDFKSHDGTISTVEVKGKLGRYDGGNETIATINFDPWMIKEARLRQSGNNGWLPGYWQISVKGQGVWLWTKTYPGTLGWMSTDSKEGVLYTSWWDLSSYTKRTIISDAVSSMGTITDGIGRRTIYFSYMDAWNHFTNWNSPEWGAFVSASQMITDQYGTYFPNYSVNNYADPPGEIVVVADSRFQKGVHYVLEHHSPGLQYSFYPELELWNKMTADGIDTATFLLEWRFPTRSTNNPATKQCVMTFNRKVFRVKNLAATGALAVGPNYYYNKNNKNVTITGQIYNNIGVDDVTLWQNNSFSGTASLIRGNGPDGEKICDLTISKGAQAKEIKFTGMVPENYTTGNDGIYLKVNNISLGDYVLGGNINTYFSAHKADTVTPVLSIADENKEAKDISGEWENVHKFYIVSSEALTGAVASYKLYDENDQLVRITNYSGGGGNSANGQTVPADTNIITGAQVNLKLSDYIEGKYQIKIQGSDIAGNSGEVTVTDIRLDNKAPTTTVASTPQERAADGTKRIDYEFSISDASGNGRVYYCFVKNGVAIPDKSSEQWKYVQKGDASTTAVLQVDDGYNFVGKIYYYTEDEQGNNSYVQSGNQYFSMPIAVYNESVTTEITVADMTPGLFIYLINFDIEGQDRLEYKWEELISNNPGFTQADYRTYDGELIGRPRHIGDDKGEYLFDGTYKLLYKIINKISGLDEEGSYTFLFDNSNPTINLPVWTNGTKIREAQPVRISITDTGTIKNAYCTIVDMNNDDVEAPSIPLTIGSDGWVNTEIDVSYTSNGIYGLKIYAEDINGYFKEVGYDYLRNNIGGLDDGRNASYYKEPDMRFAVRIQKPELKVLNPYRTAETQILEKIGDNIYRTGKTDYTLKFSSEENMSNVEYLGDTYLKYQISSDGINWSLWTDAGLMSKNTERDTNHLDFTIPKPYVLREGQNKIYVRTACYNFKAGDNADKQAELSRNPGAELISTPAEVIIELDTVLPQYTLAYASKERTGGDVPVTLTIKNDSNKTYTVTSDDTDVIVNKLDNENYKLTIKDNTDAQVIIEDNLGNKTAASVKVNWIDREAPSAELIGCAPYYSGDRKDGQITIKIKDAMRDTTRFALTEEGGSLTEDDFDRFNQYKAEGKIKTSLVAAETSNGEVNEEHTIYIKGISGNYSLGYSSSDTLENTISAIIAGTELSLIDIEAQLKEVSYNPEITTKSYTEATLKFNVPVAVLPNYMVRDNEEANLISAVQYGRNADAKYALEHKFIYTEKDERTYYVCDEAARSKKISFTMDGVQFIEGFAVNTQYLLNGEPVTVNDGKWIGIEDDGDLQVLIRPNPEYYAQYFLLLAEGDSDMVLNLEDSVIVSDPPHEVVSTFSAIGYTGPIFEKLTFDVLKNGNNIKQWDYMSYTMEGTPEERLQEESIYITNIDETAPGINWSLSNTNPTNKSVKAYISFSDTESGIAKVEVSHNGGDYVETDKGEYLEDNIIELTINDELDKFFVRVTNNAGLRSEVSDISAPNIDIAPITIDEHYRVEYSFENYAGVWVPVEKNGFYRSVKAEIVPADTKKELYIYNNNGSFEKILTNSLQTFVFDIRDRAGNSANQSVEYTGYDTQSPLVSHSISPANKTNKPVTVNIRAEDNINTIAHCELYSKIDNEIIEIKGVEKVGEGQYTASAENNGDYVIYVWDGAGNKATHNFKITNIDKSPVEVTSIRYSTPPDIKTGQTVLVTIVSFNKTDVSMVSVDIPDGIALTQNDIVVSSDLKSIRFKKNGSIEATFVDAYGNIGKQIITVNHIKTTPPMCEGKYDLSEKLTNATISFQSMKSDFGYDLEPDLSRIYVVSGLVKSAARVTAEEAKIIVNDNGTYNFTLSDEVGNSRIVSVNVEGIDKVPPKVTAVSWNYEYMKENTGTGEWEPTTESNTDSAPAEGRYTLSGDTLPETNQDVTVTVTTDKEITQIGSFDKTPRTETVVKYSKNGVFSFNLEATNKTSVLYGVNVKLIDKDKPLLQFDNTDELIFIEGDTRTESIYDISKLYDFTAYDMRSGEALEIPKEKVKLNFGRFNPNDISKNEFNRNSPYYIVYSVADSAGNIAEVTRTVRLIGLTDTVALINGKMPNANSIAAVNGTGEFTVSLKNNSGKAYVKYEQGMHTVGQMKYTGTAVGQNEDGSFTVNAAESGWYTVSVQTDRKDFFNIMVYINLEGSGN